jgi:PAS domain-containing protein
MVTSTRDEGIFVRTDAVGVIVSCSSGAVKLLGYTARGARGRELPNMFVTDRPRLSELLAVAQGLIIDRVAEFRPNDRKAVRVRFRVSAGEDEGEQQGTLLWTFFVRWPVTMCLPRGADRRQLITVWRSAPLRCIFVPSGLETRRLLVCSEEDEVVHEELASEPASALARAAELLVLAQAGELPSFSSSAPAADAADRDRRLT